MDAKALTQLIGISHAVGSDTDLVQAGGGNTSVKSADGRGMYVKASGLALADMNEARGWVELDLPAVRAILDDEALAARSPDPRETEIARRMALTVRSGSGRPSVEAVLHAFLGPVVIHTHPVAVNALTCGPGESALETLVRPDETPPLWMPCTDPGWVLARAIRDAAGVYEKQHGVPPAVIFLGNHGLFVSADSTEACLALHEAWVERCRDYFIEAAPGPAACSPVKPEDLRACFAAIHRARHEAGKAPGFLRLSRDLELNHAAASDLGDTLAQGALTPDHVVYVGPRMGQADSLREAAELLSRPDAGAPPLRLVLVRNTGAIVVADTTARLEAIETMAASSAKTLRYAAGRGGAHNMSREAVDVIVSWEAEHYRASLLDAPRAPLAGRVALVTGAASGLGLGIARGLVEAGAAVAFTDIDADGLAKSVEGIPRALAVPMDVTDEAALARGFDAVVRHWGGLDVLVCAAGIAPPYDLVEMPVDQWRRALEVNLTGYFLAAREAARVMKAQGCGGSMIMLSSKTGLEASRANSAYNATKAGELHLMRGWALELGGDGIRVNAVAPGNVFEGSNIWNPEYIKVCAKKKGIRPEEVIPHYTSLTALGREIKREDVANAVVFLCSDAARCITGQTLVVDGGQVMVR